MSLVPSASEDVPSAQPTPSTCSSPLPSHATGRRMTSSKDALKHGTPSVNGKPGKLRTLPRLAHDTGASPGPSTLMHWHKAAVHGYLPSRAFRAHSVTLNGDGAVAWMFGGCDMDSCANDVYAFDIETMRWCPVPTQGDLPPNCRAHTATLVDNRNLVVIGGGEDGTYYDHVYVLDTLTRRWSKPLVQGSTTSGTTPVNPPPRRAHTAVFYLGRIWVFGGGDGVQALNDVWCLEVGSICSDNRKSPEARWRWHGPLRTTGPTPRPRGYHTANLVGKIMVVVGGSDGRECFGDVWCLNLDTLTWSAANLDIKSHRRLSHTSTQVGSYLFIIGGHDGADYRSEVLALNLVSLQYESRQLLGRHPASRGYHAAVLADARIFVFGGYNGGTAFDDVWILELAAAAYLPQVTSFLVDVHVHAK